MLQLILLYQDFYVTKDETKYIIDINVYILTSTQCSLLTLYQR